MAQNKKYRKRKVWLVGDTPKEKWNFFWKYYKWNALICLIGLFVFGSIIYKSVTVPIFQMQGFLLNTENDQEDTSANELARDFIEANNIDTSLGRIVLNDDWTYEPGNEERAKESTAGGREMLIQKQNQTLDFITGYKETMLDLAYNTFFTDISTLLSTKQLEEYKPYLLYIDQSVSEELAQAYEDKKDLSTIEIPDPTKPEEMKEPVPVLIDISHCEKLSHIYDSPKDTLAFGFIDSAPDYKLPIDFLLYIMEQED